MNTLITILLISLLQSNKILSQIEYGNIFPIPLTITDEDVHFQQCPEKNGAYSHATNCSLFHLCTFGIHTLHSCIDGFFFNPTTRRCDYLPIEQPVKCDVILQTMEHSLVEFVSVPDVRHRRKSVHSKCTRTGIYPDLLDCSLFHYCHQNKQHQIIPCPQGLNFDPRTMLCLASQLVDCQYEPSRRLEEETDYFNSHGYSSALLDTICRDYAPGTYLPLSNHFDKYLICRDDGRTVVMKCTAGFTYNALTTACEAGPCTFDSTLCENEGRCVDDMTTEKGFQCICPNEYEGELCESRRNGSLDDLPKLDADEQQPSEYMVRMGLVFATSLIGIILLGAIVFAAITLIRLICFTSMMSAGQWRTLREESVI